VSRKEPIRTERAPGAVGPYSQGIVAGDLVFSSGQMPVTPDGKMVDESIGAAAKQCLDNVLAILAEAGAKESDVLKVTVFLTDMADFGEVNAVYETVFSEPYPARSCVEVSGLPKGVPVEIEAIARVPGDAT